MEMMQYEEALQYIHHVDWRKSRLGLARTRELLCRIGDPQRANRFIHVAGTNGKGSTTAMLAQILTCAGYRTGMYTSPFINRFNERMQVDGEPISDAELAEITAFIKPHADAMADHPTEFELVTAIGFEYFRRHGCEIVVLEVGMGGEFDSTNVIDTPELAIITNMGLDHVRELGPTMSDIARAKAGIIKPNGTVVTYGRNPEADAVFAAVCLERGATLIAADHEKIRRVRPQLDGLTFDYGDERDLFCSLIGSYQLNNASVALTAVEQLRKKGWRIPSGAVRNGLSSVRWPARFEILMRNPLFIADGGHNPQGIEAAVDSLRLHLPDRTFIFLLGIMADKDIPHMIAQLGPLAERFFTVTPNNPRAMPAKELAAQLQALGYPAEACESVEDGVRAACAAAGKTGAVCALGSLYLLGDVRKFLHAGLPNRPASTQPVPQIQPGGSHMTYKSDIEIAQETPMLPIEQVAASAGIDARYLELYGRYKAKVDYALLKESPRANGKLVLVTAITPTPAGEGKTTTTVGLADGLRKLGKQAIVALREPSLGPVFGIKGGAAGGGRAQVVPMEDINLHFTGDFHAIGAANNLLAALLDNHIYQGNRLNIDPRRITWRRCVDMNDRQLRFITDGLGGRVNGVPREDGYDITVASEVMAVLCLSSDISDLKTRLSRLIVGYTYDEKPVTAGDLNAQGAMAALLRDALKPNLVQTLEHTPAFVHGGPFANIAHGCNSVTATRMALKLADYTVTEAGFGADLGAEKFLDIKCRAAGLKPDAVVMVATVRALKLHGGVPKAELNSGENLAALERGLPNLLRHVENITSVYRLPCVVAVNRFPTDTEAELRLVEEKCRALGVNVARSEVWEKGGAGGAALAEEVVRLCEQPNDFAFSYALEGSIEDKISAIVKRVYRGDGAVLTPAAKKQAAALTALGFAGLPVCMAKTQYSFSDDPLLLGAPTGFTVTVRGIRASAGAGFLVALTGDIMTMPGLPKVPAAERIDVDETGKLSGLF